MRIRLPILVLVLTLLMAACGTSTAVRAPEVAVVEPTAEPTTEPTAVPTAAPTATLIPTVEPTAEPTTEPTPEPVVEAPAEAAAVEVAPEIVAADVNDTPELAAYEEPVTQVAYTEANLPPSQPVRLQIPAIKLDYRPVAVGLDANRVPIVPRHDVGWYSLSAMPGQGENVVFWGHVLRFRSAPKIPAPFARVKELKRGAQVIVTTANGTQRKYQVTQAVQVTPDQVQYILPTGKEQITLVSCIGDNVVQNGSVTKKYRLITIAEPVK
jgi:LPXTG-site transpeptidase (sortase) family protein